MTKIAVTIRDEQMRRLEQLRQRRRVPRSRVIQQALDAYFAQTGLTEEIHAYEQAYRRRPENTGDLKSLARAAAEVLDAEEWS